MSKIKKIILIIVTAILIAIALFFAIRPCPKYYLSQVYPDPRYVPLTEKLIGWYVKAFCPGATPVSVLINTAFAQSVNTDLANLKTNFPTLVRAYDKIKIFDAWSFINSKLVNFSNIVVGIIDTGIDSQHPEFSGVNFGNSPLSALEDKAIEFPNSLPSGHGTAVAGVIGANNLSASQMLSSSNPQMNGIITGITSPSYTIESRSARGLVTSVKINSIISTFPINSVVNISFKQTDCLILNIFCVKTEDFNNLTKLYQETFAANPDKTFVIAAGNDGINVQKSIPSNINLPNTIIVTATDLNDNRADFGFLRGSSNFGTGVDISAPGIEVYAPAIRGKGNFPTSGQEAFNYKTDFSGTSASAPMVTGVAGLIKAIKPNLTPAQIKQILVSNADTIQADKPIGGRLNALKAVCDPLVLNCAPTPPPIISPWPMLQKNAQRTGLIDIAGPPFATSTQATVKWQKTLDLPSFFPPIISSQAVYVGVGSNLIAFDKTNGNQVWQVNIPAGAVNGAIGPDGTIYVCGLNTNQQSILTAVNPTDGAIKWQFIVGPFRPCNPPVTSQNGIIYTTIPPPLNTQLAVVVAVNPDGTQKWRYEEGNIATTPPALANDESQLYVGFDNNIKSFNASTGQILWTGNVPFFPFLIAVDPNDRVPIQTLNGPITTFSKAGAQIWQTGNVSSFSLYLQDQILTTNPSSFAIRNASGGGFVSGGFWPNGFQLPGNAFPIVDKDGIFYLPLAIFGSPAQVRIFAFDFSGNQRWTFDVPSTLNFVAIGGSALDSDGSLYLVAQGKLIKLGK